MSVRVRSAPRASGRNRVRTIRALHAIRLSHAWKTRLYVVVATDDGTMGIGEATLGQLSHAVEGALCDLESSVVGLDLHDVARVRQQLRRDIYADGGQVLAAALGGIEIAMWDALGRIAGEPVYNLLGGRVTPRLRLYANGWYRSDREPEAVARLARRTAAKGYTALKIDPFGANWRTIPERELDLSLEILRAVRAAIGEEADLIVEAHSRFDAATAGRIAKRLEPLRPLWFEEPVPYTDLRGYRELAGQIGIPIAAGESLWRVSQFIELLEAAPISVIQVDPTHVGGLGAAAVIAELAYERNARLAPHSASGVVNELACAHLATASSHALLLERFEGAEPDDPHASLLGSSLQVASGFAELGREPGLGVAFSLPELLEAQTAQAGADQNLFRQGWERRQPR